MFKKFALRRKIRKCKKEFLAIEQKRSRSQAALVEAILTNQSPSDQDVDFFNKYTAEIEAVRSEMHELETALKNL